MNFHQDINGRSAEMREHLLQVANGADIQGMELSAMIRILANYYAAVITKKSETSDLSGPRMGILLRLFIAEANGEKNGINPTTLSHFQHVRKNTMSSLLRGLEDSGLVERTLDPDDKRVFLIHITEKGKQLVQETGPKRVKLMNDLSSELTKEEKDQLLGLLEKLRVSIQNQVDFPLHFGPEGPGDCELEKK